LADLGHNVVTGNIAQEAKDAPDHGILGVLKGVATKMLGGPMKGAPPVDYNKAHADMNVILHDPTSTVDYWHNTANVELQKALSQNPNPTQEEVGRAAQTVASNLKL